MPKEKGLEMDSARDRQKAKEIICAIIAESGGRLYGSTRLYKAFYHAHLYHWNDEEGVLSLHPIVHMPQGPGIDEGEALVSELENEKVIKITTRKVGPYREDVYELQGRHKSSLTAAEQRSIRRAVKFVNSKTARYLSDKVHEDSHSLPQAKIGEELNIYLDTLSDRELEAMRARQEEVGRLLGKSQA